MKEVYVFMADGTEEIEALTVVDLLRRAQISVSTVSVNNAEYITGSHGIVIKMDKGIDSVDWDNACMLVLPGGKVGTDNLMGCAALCDKLKEFAAAGKYVAAVCAAPSVLGVNGILKDKKATCYPGFEEKLIGAECVKEPVVKDGNVITSRGLGTSIEFAASIISTIKDEDTAESVLKKIIYKSCD